MRLLEADVLVIGSGPAGLAAAYQARVSGAKRVTIIERNREPGGILPQCIHNGFGLRIFGRDLTGPEYAQRWLYQAQEAGVEIMTRTMVQSITPDLRITASGNGTLVDIKAKALILATGCRERPRGALGIPGARPAGIYTAGTAQRLVNIEGYMPGRRFVILGSGDIGMIMARRLTLEGAQVMAMAEILPYVSGLRRNLVQCVRDFDIPLYTSTTITEIRGRERVESVVMSAVDEHWQPIKGTQRELACDTLLLSAGLLPEIELARLAGVKLDPVTGGAMIDERQATNVPDIYAAGNMVHVYDLVDSVSESALRAGCKAAEACSGHEQPCEPLLPLVAGENVHHVVPQYVHIGAPRELIIELRVKLPLEEPAVVQLTAGDKLITSERLRYARPSEMIALRLRPEQYQQIGQAPCLRAAVVRASQIKTRG
ncbi:MAG: NAD(P)/FAD-dependent oxidoreductase [Chloroflexi bacterium]|nr:NAD(P)/FAD-dependent oxidoreductase [Chloroflexota bacterium]